jgi:undecaprenyl-diphosphatase
MLGCFQMLALVPGTSRSGSTILGGIVIGLERQAAAQFSFFMAIPIMTGASLLKLLKLGFSYSVQEYVLLAIGFVSSFIVSLFCIKVLIAYVRKHDFSVFGIYRIALSIVVVAFFLTVGA